MCDYYVEMMCASRFGLGWAYDVFTFACHMFIHFSFIRTNFVSIILILNCIGSFLCVSLSLSLSFVSCSMAPKQKSTPARNPLRSGASSSSPFVDPTPSHVWFHDDKACKDFSENFSRRDIHSECQVVLSDFFDTDLPTIIYNRCWKHGFKNRYGQRTEIESGFRFYGRTGIGPMVELMMS